MDDDVEQGETNLVADKPAGRTSLKEKLEVMKAKVATAGRTEQTVQKGGKSSSVIISYATLFSIYCKYEIMPII